MQNAYDYVQDYFSQAITALARTSPVELLKIARVIVQAANAHKTVYVFGNGGSAATASHFANDLLKMAGVRAICLTDMTPTTLAFMNDEGVDTMFDNILSRLERPCDVVFAISCSGNSSNVVTALQSLQENTRDIQTILLTGDNPNSNGAAIAHYTLFVPHSDIRIQEDAHLVVCHCLAGLVKEILDGNIPLPEG